MSQISLEVNVQDYFWFNRALEPKADQTLEQACCPISPASWEKWFTQWFQILHPNIPQARCYELSLRLTDNTEIQQFNAQYRSLNVPTDVLAFATLEMDCPQIPALEVFASDSLYLGDIIISVEIADRQAQQQGHSLTIELAWLAAHGFLHLLGWDHPDQPTLLEMFDQQEVMLKSVGLAVNTHAIREVSLTEYSLTAEGGHRRHRR